MGTTAAAETEGRGEAVGEEDGAILQLLDSLDGYISLMGSLSSSLRQGWLELSSARHSMGNSRISSTLFDMKPHSSATTVDLTVSTGESPSHDADQAMQPHFSLLKWGSRGDEKSPSVEVDGKTPSQASSCSGRTSCGLLLLKTDDSDEGGISATIYPAVAADNQVRKKRSKALSMFGALVPPKLRVAQGSFETSLEAIIEIANTRSTILSALGRLQTVDLRS
ncbi:unnamed protein product [Spirodela intermedia]|uniref:Vacuolar ATPase assembly protein VMA22 n=1 Tax=Spirodela intermedia TaxID=51605 RepID=A0A7I8J982_SPIIN|nr:unnamed protein product [Spirodela intermedia]CAA6666649.1 unnamed protein product [Spirodela intermedia]